MNNNNNNNNNNNKIQTAHLISTRRPDLSKVKLATIVEGDPKAPFSIAYYTKV